MSRTIDISVLRTAIADWVEATVPASTHWADSKIDAPSPPYVRLTEVSNVRQGEPFYEDRQFVTEWKFTLGDVVETESRILVINGTRSEHVVQAGEDIEDVRDGLVALGVAAYPSLDIAGLAGEGEIKVRRGTDLGSLRTAMAFPTDSWTTEEVALEFLHRVNSRRALTFQFAFFGDSVEGAQMASDLSIALGDLPARAGLEAVGLSFWSMSGVSRHSEPKNAARRWPSSIFTARFGITADVYSAGPTSTIQAFSPPAGTYST